MMLKLQMLYASCSLLFYAVMASSTYYPIDPSKAYEWKGIYPQSCECMETGVSLKSCSLFRCTCTCDLNAGKCDYGCCCDPDCDASQISRFKEIDACLPEGFTTDTTGECYSALELQTVNPRFPIVGVESTARKAVDEALCIERRNYALPGMYFSDIEKKAASIFNDKNGKKYFSYIENLPIKFLVDGNFDQNDTISAFSVVPSGAKWSIGRGYWQLPRPDYAGACNVNNVVRYEVSLSPESCNRLIPLPTSPDFQAQCLYSWSLASYVNNLRLIEDAGLSISSASIKGIAISINSLVYEDFYSGVKTVLPVTSACVTTSLTAASFLSVANDCSKPSAEFLAKINVTPASVCSSSVKSIDYKVIHEASNAGYIQTVLADIVITDVPSMGTGAAGPSLFSQSFAVEFTSENAAGRSDVNGNLVARGRSGNPGYITGLPVVYGVNSKEEDAFVNAVVDGLKIPSPRNIYCPTNASKESLPHDPISFGYDFSSGCVLSLTRDELAKMCCQGTSGCSGTSTSSQYSDPITGIPYFFDGYNSGRDFIGMFGNADPLDITQWYKLAVTIPSGSNRIWDDQLGVCKNMFTGLNFKFLVAKSGELMNPQNKIIAAAVELTTSDFTSSSSYNDQITKQAFPLSVTVSFIFKNINDLQGYVAPPPPVLFKVPYDAFYPFQSSAASSRKPTAIIYLLSLTLVMASYFLMF